MGPSMRRSTSEEAAGYLRLMQVTLRALPVVLPIVATLTWALPFSMRPLLVYWDLASMLQAAVRYAHGEGLTHSPAQGILQLDPALPTYTPITYWTPGYPFLIGNLLQHGLSLEAAVKAVQVFFWLLGWFAWGIVLRKTVPFDPRYWLALIGLPIVFPFPLAGTDVILWAISPVWLLAIQACLKAGTDAKAIAYAASAGALAGLAYFFRYASLFLVLPGTFCLALVSRGGFARRFLPSMVFLTVISSMVGTLSLYNWLASGAASLLDHLPSFDIRPLLTLGPMVNFFPGPLIENLPLVASTPYGRFISACFAALCLWLALRHWLAFRKTEQSQGNNLPTFIQIVLASYVSVAGMLLYTSGRLGVSSVWPDPANDGRYYLPVYLSCLAIMLAVLHERESLGVRPTAMTQVEACALVPILAAVSYASLRGAISAGVYWACLAIILAVLLKWPSAGVRPTAFALVRRCTLLLVVAAVSYASVRGAVSARYYWQHATSKDSMGLEFSYDFQEIPHVVAAIEVVRKDAANDEKSVIFSPSFVYFGVLSDIPAYNIVPRIVGPSSPTHVFVVVRSWDVVVRTWRAVEGPAQHQRALEFIDRYRLKEVRDSRLRQFKLYHRLLPAGEAGG